MNNVECPRCRRKTVVTVMGTDGLAEKTRCSSCGWTGPKCFAQKWDPNSPECVGGADPTHWEGETHVRSRCSFERSCRLTQEQAKKEALIAPMNMLTQPRQQVEITPGPGQMRLPPQTPPQQPLMQQPLIQQPYRPAPQQAQPYNNINLRVQQAPVATRPVAQYPVQPPIMAVPMAYVPPLQAHYPMFVPQNYAAPGMQMPAYLTVPEPVEQGIVPMFVNSALRAGGKAVCHTFANLFDHFTWGTIPAPPAPPPTP